MGFPVGGTGVGGSPVPPGIYESQTSAFNETMKNIIGMLPFDTSVIIPFTQQDFDEVFHYRSEPERPMLHPLLFLRTAEEMGITADDLFHPIYQELLESLPPEIGEWLTNEMRQPFAERDPDAVALHHTLSATASAIGWLSVVTQPIEPNSAAATYLMLNMTLPFVALNGALSQADFVLRQAMSYLSDAGPNYQHFDTYSSSFSDIQSSITEALALQREIEKGLVTEDVKRRLVQTANLLHEIADRFTTNSVGHDFLIVGAQLEALATATAALALSHGTPSLVLGSSAALIGLNNHTSVLGPFGFGFDTVVDAVVDGILDSFLYGPRAEINELKTLYQDLIALREGLDNRYD